MYIFKLIGSFFSFLMERIFPANLRPAYIFLRIRNQIESLIGRLDKARDLQIGDLAKPKAVPWIRYILQALLLTAIVLGLWYLNSVLDLDKVLRSPWPVLHRFWLPILFILGYILYWLGRWLWLLLGPDKNPSEFPDIDEAWDEAVATLRQTGIAITQVPLFLVLGRPSSSLKQFFDAAQMTFPVRHMPRKADAPLHVTANTEGIFVSCEGASLLGKQAAMLLEDDTAEASEAPPAEDKPALPPVLEYEEEKPAVVPAAGEAEADATTAAPVLLLADEATGQALRLRKHRAPLLKNTAEVLRLTARLQHLCRLIARQRQPYCPVNGILVVLPLAATNSIEDASQTGAVCQNDLATARQTLEVHCPLLVALADMESVPGFCEMLEQFPEARQRQYVLGQPFPLVPDVEEVEIPHMIGRGVRWLFETLFPTNIYKLLRLEAPASGQRSAVVRTNSKLFQLLVQMRDRYNRLNHILTRGLTVPADGPLLFGGAFLTATGPDAAREQAFVHGVLRQMIDNQNYVSWTKDALNEEAVYRRWTQIGYLVLLAFSVTMVIVAYVYWPRR